MLNLQIPKAYKTLINNKQGGDTAKQWVGGRLFKSIALAKGQQLGKKVYSNKVILHELNRRVKKRKAKEPIPPQPVTNYQI